ncbi:MAG: hypothetical protein VR69_02460 [Peptococcaceae bacterium BRH_c4b]|nr:MAG: hypothetical protein VR69_02460 [Peptococcaceae bacterium BRH_c4b]
MKQNKVSIRTISLFLVACFLMFLFLGQGIKVGKASGNKTYVIHLVVDGLSDKMYDQIKADPNVNTPNIDDLIAKGARLRGVNTVVPSYGGSQAAVLTGAGTGTNKFLYRYYDKKSKTVQSSPAVTYNMAAQTIFEKLKADNTGVKVLATGWCYGNKSIEGRGVSTIGNGYKLIEHAKGDALVSFSTAADEVVAAISSSEIPQFITAYSNDIKMVGWGGTGWDTPSKRANALTAIDAKIGAIKQALADRGIADKTTIILHSLTGSYVVGNKVDPAALATAITNGTGVKTVSSSSTVTADAKAMIIKTYYMSYAQLSFTGNAGEQDKADVLAFLKDPATIMAENIEGVYTPGELGAPAEYADYIINPMEGKTFCAEASGVYRTDDLYNREVFCVVSGGSTPAGSGVQGELSILDIIPTICAMLGVQPPINNEGRPWIFEQVQNPPVITLRYQKPPNGACSHQHPETSRTTAANRYNEP